MAQKCNECNPYVLVKQVADQRQEVEAASVLVCILQSRLDTRLEPQYSSSDYEGVFVLLIIFQSLLLTRATSEIIFHIPEEQMEGTRIGSLKDYLSLKAPLEFTLLDTSKYFHLDTQSGDLYTTAKKLDRESLCSLDDINQCVISMDVFISSKEQSEVAKIKIFILDVNDNAPIFTEKNIILSIPEDAPVGATFAIDHLASDPDTENNSALMYYLICRDDVFSLEHYSEVLSLSVQKPLDRESQSEYHMDLIATDRGLPPLSGSAKLIVHIMDVNDNCPTFLANNISVNLPRNSSVNSTLVQLVAVDDDIGDNNIIQYVYSSRVPEASKKLFNLNSTTGIIILSKLLLRDTPHLHKLMVLAIGSGCAPAMSTVTVTIEESKRKEPSMEFRFLASQDNESVLIKEDVPANTIIAILELKDPDHNILRPPYINGTSPFSIKPSENSLDTYLLLTCRSLDFELEQSYSIQVIGNATSENSIMYQETLSIKIGDVNDNSPQFPQNVQEIFIEENNRPGAFLLTLSASDSDSGVNSNISYSLKDGVHMGFSLDSSSGVLTASVSFDREKETSYTLLVVATDHGSPSRNDSCIVIINILDQNDNAPVFPTSEFTFFIPENLPKYGKVGLINVTDADIGLNGQFSVALLNVTTLFSVEHDIILISEDCFDYESELVYELWIEAKDKGVPPFISRVKVLIFILDVNDNAPLILLPESNYSYVFVPSDTSKGSSVTKVHAVDYDAGMNGMITYSIFGDMGPAVNLFIIDELTGNITLKENGYQCGLYQLMVKASDQGYPEALSTIVRVNILLNHSISNRSYLESIIMGNTSISNENQVVMLSPCPQYQKMDIFSWSLSAPIALAVMAISALCCVTGTLLFFCTRIRRSKRKKKPDIQIPLKLNVDHYVKDYDEVL
ncbi:protocadherin-20-like [Rhinophrynus dorsalis]